MLWGLEMLLEYFKDNELAHVSYIVGCEKTGELALVDPSRNIEPYLDYVQTNGLHLKYILNTHPHADFVSGHKLLADQLEAINVYCYNVPSAFACKAVKEQDVITIGDSIQIKVIETPGHTPFCISYLVQEDGIDKILFSGDFLFSGGIGRPDLLGKETKKVLLEQSYDSCRKLGLLSDHIIVCPSHSGGTMCGKDLKDAFLTTIGIEKKANQAFSLGLQDTSAFIDYMNEQDIDTPAHFKKMGTINLRGAGKIRSVDDIPVLSPEVAYRSGEKIIDMRDIYAFMGRHIEGSVNVPHNANVALIAGSILSQEEQYILLLPSTDTPKNLLKKILIRLGSVGIDKIVGVVFDGLYRLREKQVPLKSVRAVSAEEVQRDKNFTVIELGNEKIEGAKSEKVELSAIGAFNFQSGKKYTFICSNSFKSMAAVSLLQEKENIFFLHR
jgi:hydroxyacylglutathione hydrolase